jgi:calcineurin-like phosphoesterase
MRLAFFGDTVGKAGRTAIAEYLPRLKAELRLDFVVVNGSTAGTVQIQFETVGANHTSTVYGDSSLEYVKV